MSSGDMAPASVADPRIRPAVGRAWTVFTAVLPWLVFLQSVTAAPTRVLRCNP